MTKRSARDLGHAAAQTRWVQDEINRVEAALDSARGMRGRFEDRIGSRGEDYDELQSAIAMAESEIVGLEEELRDAEARLQQVAARWVEEV